MGWFLLIEALCYGVVYGVECCDCGVFCSETVLVCGRCHVGYDVWEEYFFKCFGDG